MGAGVASRSEESTALGRPDVTLEGSSSVFEFKMKGRGGPLEQALRKGCADRYRPLGGRVHVMGVTMDPATRNVECVESVRPFAAWSGAPGPAG